MITVVCSDNCWTDPSFRPGPCGPRIKLKLDMGHDSYILIHCHYTWSPAFRYQGRCWATGPLYCKETYSFKVVTVTTGCLRISLTSLMCGAKGQADSSSNGRKCCPTCSPWTHEHAKVVNISCFHSHNIYIYIYIYIYTRFVPV